ncbi:MAG: hypothetical protein IRZ28_13220 [Steroidobacteraceae bacterium]|nr:hypothetical protein [Steroidobacteraceae bacterium]
MAAPNPFDRFDTPAQRAGNPFDQFDEDAADEPAGLREPGNIDLHNRPGVKMPDGSIAHGHGPIGKRYREPLPEVIVSAQGPIEPEHYEMRQGRGGVGRVLVPARFRESSWGETARSAKTTIGARIEQKLAGLQEYVGNAQRQDAQKKLWQSIILPQAVRDAAASGENIDRMPAVIQAAERVGVRPDVFARDWPAYVNRTPDDLVSFQHEQVARIAAGAERAARGRARAHLAAEVARDYAPELEDWSVKKLAFDVATSSPDLLAGAAASVAGGPVAGLGTMAAIVKPEVYAQGRERGLDHRDAATYSTLMTLAEVAPELPVFEFVAKSPVGRAAQAELRKSLAAKLSETALRHAATAAVIEGLSESTTEALQIGIESGLLDEHTPLPDALKRIAWAGTVGAAMGAPLGAVTAAREAAPERAAETPAAESTREEPALGEMPIVEPPRGEPALAPGDVTVTAGGVSARSTKSVPGFASSAERSTDAADTAANIFDQFDEESAPVAVGNAASESGTVAPEAVTPAAERITSPAEARMPADETEADSARPSATAKPRLAESGDELYRQIVAKTESGVATDRGILYPVVRVPTLGTFRVRKDGIYRVGDGGVTAWKATREESDAVHDAITKDQADVVLMTRWGGSGRDVAAKPYQTLHSASGNSFAARARSAVDVAAAQVDTNPSQAQIAASNYRKGHVSLHGLDITIENPKGSERRGVDRYARKWRATLAAHYGYLKGTRGKDKEHIDVFIGPAPERADLPVYVLDQPRMNKLGELDEHKVLLAFESEAQAREAYAKSYAGGVGEKLLEHGTLTRMSLPEFKRWLAEADHTKRAAEWARRELRTETLASQQATQQMAGAQYVTLLQTRASLPHASTITVAPHTAHERNVPIPDEPVRRDTILREFKEAFNVPLFQGKPFRVRKALGYFRPKTGELRIRAHNDLEVLAHEVFHFLDREYPSLSKLYRDKRFDAEIRGVSYDATKRNEGFAEFGRLFLTQAAEASAKAPAFYQAFIAEAQRLGILDKLLRVQERMHQWYYQGALNRFRSKIGPPPQTFGEAMHALTERFADKAILETVDALQGFKVVERDLAGHLEDATVSPYKAARLVSGARGVVKAIFFHGTINWDKDGDIVFTGKGLNDIFAPVADALDQTMTYFAARRAAELAEQGRERLFAPEEIRAGLDIARKHPKGKAIEKAFDEYQAFLGRMMDFYQSSGLVSAEQRALMQEMNRSYVPFHRIVEALEGKKGPSQGAFRRLHGGTQNVRDIFDNITGSVQALTYAALRNHTKRKLFGLIERSPNGARYAVRIGTDARATRIDPHWVLEQLSKFLPPAMLARVQKIAEKDPAFLETMLLYWTNGFAPNVPDMDSVLIDGRPRYFQIADPLLMESLREFGTVKPVALGLKILGGFSGTLRRGVTMALDFQIPNLIRDTFNAFVLSKGKQWPLVDSVRGMITRLKSDEVYWEFLANGGGFASQLHAEGRALRTKLERFYVGKRIDYRRVLDSPRKILDAYDELASAFEYGTRLAEYKRMRARGASRREAALEGREISTDFGMRGASDFLRWITTAVPFMNARLEGLYRLQRQAFEKDGRAAFNPLLARQMALRAVVGLTIPSLALWWLNHDDERYKALPEWVKTTHWVILPPPWLSESAWLIPKPFETGALFASIPERTLEYVKEKDGPKYADALASIAADAFALNPTPQAVKPLVDVARNRAWSGRPIVPEHLKDVTPEEQFTPYTSDTAVRLGRAFDVSPAKLDYLLRGYFGTLGQYAITASDALINPAIDTGEKPAGRLGDDYVIRRFLRQPPYRDTSYETEFYKVLEQTREAVATVRKLKREWRTAEQAAFESDEKNAVLLAIAKSAEHVAEQARKNAAKMNQVRTDPALSADEKREQLEELQIERNELFDAYADQFSRKAVAERVRGRR